MLLEDNNNLISYYHEDAKTLYEVFQKGLKVSGDIGDLFVSLHELEHNTTLKKMKQFLGTPFLGYKWHINKPLCKHFQNKDGNLVNYLRLLFCYVSIC